MQSCPCAREAVLCGPVLKRRAGRSHTALCEDKGTLVTGISSGDIAHQCVLCGGFCSRLLSRFSWERSAREDWVQVFLLRFQGDADRYSGHAPHSPPPKRHPGPARQGGDWGWGWGEP